MNKIVYRRMDTIFDYLNDTFITICVNIILEIVLFLIGIVIVCPTLSLMLTQLVYLRIDWIVFGVIKHVIMILKPTN